MTRIWYVPFGELDDRRLLGQHREVHIIAGLVASGRSWRGFADWQLCNVHSAAVREMKKRGFPSGVYHETALTLPIMGNPGGAPEGQEGAQWPPVDVGIEDQQASDRWDLTCRRQGTYAGRVAMPEAYLPLIERYMQDGGCLHDGKTIKLRDGTIQCLTCKRAYLVAGVWTPGEWRE